MAKNQSANTTRKKKTRLSNTGAFFISLIAIIGFTCMIVFGYVFINILTVMNGDPIINLEVEKNNQNQTSFLYAAGSDGKEIEILRLHGSENRIWIDMDKIPQCTKDAFVALEDKRFNDHHGVDWIRTVGVMVKPRYSGQGGSTITQQLVKNITGNNEVTYVRKYNEIITALNLEKNYSKEQILEAYMNTLYLGQGCYGVETAAETYFGKSASELNIAESACIAAITKKPYTLDPIKNIEKNRIRQVECLKDMLEQGKISQEEYDEAYNYKLILTTDKNYVPSAEFLERQKNKEEAKGNNEFNSFYVDFVIEQLTDHLQKELGCSYKEATGLVYGGGLKIHTAVDLDVQKKLEDVYVNKTNWLDKKAQSATTVMGYNGRVVAIVGQAGEKEGNLVLNRASKSPRPPGSTIKPLSAYAPAIEEGEIYWSSYILDYALKYQGTLRPKNYSGSYGSGDNVSVQVALAKSLNTIPARIIYKNLGFKTSFDWLKNKFHISTIVDKDADLSPLSVGAMTYGITSLDLTAAYAAFGNGGYYYAPYSYYYVEDSQGKVILDNRNPKGEQIMTAETADVMRHLLETVTTSSYGTGYNYKTRGFTNYAKTGTTDNNYDKWMVGGTPYYVAATWYGYDIPKTIYCGDSNPAGRIYKTVMDKIHKGLDDDVEFEDTGNVVKKYYCTSTGKLASSSCYSTAAGWFNADDLPGYCRGHYHSKSDDDDESSSGSSSGNSDSSGASDSDSGGGSDSEE